MRTRGQSPQGRSRKSKHNTTGKLRVHLERIKPKNPTLAAAFLGAAFFLVSVMLVDVSLRSCNNAPFNILQKKMLVF